MIYKKVQELVEEVLPDFLYYELLMDGMPDVFTLHMVWGGYQRQLRYWIPDVYTWPYYAMTIADELQSLSEELTDQESMLWNYMRGVSSSSVAIQEIPIHTHVFKFYSYSTFEPPIEVSIPLKRYVLRGSVVYMGASVEHKRIVLYKEVVDTPNTILPDYDVDRQGVNIDNAIALRLQGTAYLPWPPELSEVEIAAMEYESLLVELVLYMQKLRESLRMSYGLNKVDARRLSKEIDSYIKNYD